MKVWEDGTTAEISKKEEGGWQMKGCAKGVDL